MWLLLGLCLWTVSPAFAQKKDKKDKKKDLIITKMDKVDTTAVLRAQKLQFRNINVIEYYYNPEQLAKIRNLRDRAHWKEAYPLLVSYVSSFGITNFIKDLDIVWHLARVAEYLEQTDVAKECWRIILKNHRGNPQEALMHYDSMIRFEKDLYADLSYYYELVERRKAIDTLAPPRDVLLDMGDSINSPFEDYGLTISGRDDDIIFFTSKRPASGRKLDMLQPIPPQVNEDIYFSKKNADGEWGAAKPFKEINSDYNEGSPCMNRDGNIVVFSRCYAPDGEGDCDLYVIYLQADNTWSEPANLGPEVNSYAWDSHPAFSPGGDTLYFASDRKGGFGGTDLYYTVIQNSRKANRNLQNSPATVKWSRARNMGPVINTRHSEVSPYPHPRYDVLYFSSNGHLVNFGDFDIFKSFRVNGDWTEPKNVGPLVNGKGSEFYFTIDGGSEWLFYAKSHEHDIQNLDLQSFPLPMEAQPTAVVRFSGRVIEPATGETFQGIVTVVDVTSGIEVAPKHTREDGTFEFELINHKRYLLIIEGDNFFKIEQMFYVNGDTEITIPAVSRNAVLSFQSIDFEKNSSRLLPEMENNLHEVIEFLTKYPDFNLEIIGHTDSDGSPAANLKLSQDRAQVIRKYILSYGSFEDDRVIATGKGDTEPIIVGAVTDEQKQINRRVEFKLWKPDKFILSKPDETAPGTVAEPKEGGG